MALTNFIPSVWSARIQTGLEQRYVMGNIVNRNYEGDISGFGDQVRINSIGDITVDNYVKNSTTITPEELSATQQILEIDQSKYFAFYVDDVDAAQTKPKVMDEAMRKSSRGLSGVADSFIAGFVDDAGLSAEALTMTKDDVLPLFADISAKLTEAGNPREGRFIVIPAWFEGLMVQAGIELDTANSGVLSEGYLGRFMGFDVLVSTNLEADSGDATITRAMAGTREAITFAEQIVKVEAYRPESSFSDAVKGLHVYGGKVVEPNALVEVRVQPTP